MPVRRTVGQRRAIMLQLKSLFLQDFTDPLDENRATREHSEKASGFQIPGLDPMHNNLDPVGGKLNDERGYKHSLKNSDDKRWPCQAVRYGE